MKVMIHPATPERWKDVETLFGPRGACAGCWCQFFKLRGPDYSAGRGATNKARLKRSVMNGERPGLLAYVDGAVAAWCAVEPKSRFARITRSRTLGETAGDETATTWSIPCFFTAREFRGQGLALALIEAAFREAKQGGATLVEGYPVMPAKERMPDTFAYHGTGAMFDACGFEESAAPSKSRRVMARRVKAVGPRAARPRK